MLSRLAYFLGDFYPFLILIVFSFFAVIFITVTVFKSTLSQNLKKLELSFLSFFIFLILMFVISEAYFRYIYDVSDGLGFLKVNEKWHKRHVVYNSYFFRDRDFDPIKKEGIVRIGVLGDSIAFGGGIENVDARFSNILEKKLKESTKNVEVYNLGKPGYDTEAEINEYERIKNLNFDIIIWQYFLNDVQPLEKSTGTSIISKNSQKAKIIKWAGDKSYFLDFAYWRLSSRYQNTIRELKDADINQYKNEEVLTRHKEQIADFIKSLKEENKQVLVIIFPFINLVGPSYPAIQVHSEMSNYFKDREVDVIDLLDDLKDKNPQNLVASKFDAHPNEDVHKLAADKLFEKIMPLLFGH